MTSPRKIVNGTGPENAEIVIVGEAPGAEEDIAGEPFVGPSGQELNNMLAEAGINRSECYVTNVIKIRPINNDIEEFITEKKTVGRSKGWQLYNERYVSEAAFNYITQLKYEIDQIRPNLIIALGETAMWALSGKSGITSWGGSLLEVMFRAGKMYKLIPAYHPAAILRMWEWRNITVHDLRRCAREAQSPCILYPLYNFTVRPALPTVMSWLEALKEIPKVAVDIETRNGQIACLGIARSATEAICIPFLCVETLEGYWSLEEELAIVLKLREVLTHPDIKVIGQNFIYDAQYIARHWGFVPSVTFDTMLAHHTCFPALPKSLVFLSRMYCQFHQYWKDDGKHWDPKKMPEERLWAYNCKDAVVTWEVADVLEKTIKAMELQEVWDFQMSLFMPVFRMMLRGVKIDHKLREKFAFSLIEEYAKRHQFVNTAAGRDLNIRSTKQLQEFFYNYIGIPPVKTRASRGKPSRVTTDDDALKKIGKREILMQPIVKCIAEMRSLGVYHSTFVQGQYDADRRMRCSYNIAGTTTFRFSSSEDAFGFGMNLQNVPPEDKERADKEKKNKEAIARGLTEPEFILPNIRQLFIPDDGCYILDWDLDRADLQVVVWEADDETLRLLLKEGIDLHLANAQVLFKLPYTLDNLRDPKFVEQAKADYNFQRQMTKIFTHGTNYGGSPRTMAAHCEVSVSEAYEMQDRWFAAHPAIKSWHHRVQHQLAEGRMVQNAFGYRRDFFDRIEGVLPEALAWIPQSTVACIINRVLRRIDKELPSVQLLLQVHDSLVMQAPKAEVDNTNLLSEIRERMKVVVPYKQPLIIPSNCKMSDKSWGDAKGVKIVEAQ